MAQLVAVGSPRVRLVLACLALAISVFSRWYLKAARLRKIKLTPGMVRLVKNSYKCEARGGRWWEQYPKVLREAGNIAVVQMEGGVRFLLDSDNSDESPAVLAAGVAPGGKVKTLLPSEIFQACLPFLLYSPHKTSVLDLNHAGKILQDKSIALLGVGSGEVYRVLSGLAAVTVVEPSQAAADAAKKYFLFPESAEVVVPPKGSFENWVPRKRYNLIMADLTRTKLNSNYDYLTSLRERADYVIGIAMHPLKRSKSDPSTLASDVLAWSETFPSVITFKALKRYRVIVASSTPSLSITKSAFTCPEVKAKLKSLIATLQLRTVACTELKDGDIEDWDAAATS